MPSTQSNPAYGWEQGQKAGVYLQQLPQARDDAAADELRHVQAGRLDAGRVGAADAVDPLHDQHARTTQVGPHPGDLHCRVIGKIPPKILRSAPDRTLKG